MFKIQKAKANIFYAGYSEKVPPVVYNGQNLIDYGLIQSVSFYPKLYTSYLNSSFSGVFLRRALPFPPLVLTMSFVFFLPYCPLGERE